MPEKKKPKPEKPKSKPEKSTKPKAKSEKVDVHSLEGTASDIAYLVGLSTPNITQLLQSGVMKRSESGKFNFVECVSSYCRSMRNRKSGNEKSELEIELSAWKLQNLKLRNRDWRMQRDRMVATEILKSLSEAVGGLREKAKMNPALCEEIDQLLSCIGRIDVEGISLAVEGDETEDDE